MWHFEEHPTAKSQTRHDVGCRISIVASGRSGSRRVQKYRPGIAQKLPGIHHVPPVRGEICLPSIASASAGHYLPIDTAQQAMLITEYHTEYLGTICVQKTGADS